MTFDGAIILNLGDVTQVNCVHLHIYIYIYIYGAVLLPYFGLNSDNDDRSTSYRKSFIPTLRLREFKTLLKKRLYLFNPK